NVVQSRDDEQAVEETVGKQTPAAGVHDSMAEGVDARIQPGVGEPERCGEHESGQAADDRNETAPGEKGEIVWQLERGEAVVEDAAEQSGNDADRHVELVDRRGPPCGFDGLAS